MRLATFAFVIAAGCGGSSKSSTTPKADEPTCAVMADAMVARMAEGKEATPALVETKERLTKVIRTSCEQDAWSRDARQCIATMKTGEEAEHCATLLTEQQQDNLARAQAAANPDAAVPEDENTSDDAAAPPAAPPPPPPPPPASPGNAEEGAMGSKEKPKRAPPKATKTRKTGDPCDGGE